jgi:hypothetical protein
LGGLIDGLFSGSLNEVVGDGTEEVGAKDQEEPENFLNRAQRSVVETIPQHPDPETRCNYDNCYQEDTAQKMTHNMFLSSNHRANV